MKTLMSIYRSFPLIATWIFILLSLWIFVGVAWADNPVEGMEGISGLFGHFLSALGGALIAFIALRTHITNTSIHHSVRQLDEVYLRRGEISSLGDRFISKETCELTHKATLEQIAHACSSIERLERKLDRMLDETKRN